MKKILLLKLIFIQISFVYSQTILKDHQSPTDLLFAGDIEIGDFNNDGIVDMAVCGLSEWGSDAVTKVYRGLGGFQFEEISIDFVGVHRGGVRWIDYDNDSDLDLIVFGAQTRFSPNALPVTYLYENLGGDDFQLTSFEFIPILFGDIAVGDLNNDGRSDIVMTGGSKASSANYNDVSGPILTIYYNQPNGEFTQSEFSFDPLMFSSIDLGDFNKDQLLDIIVSGQNNNVKSTMIYVNEGNDNFSQSNQSLIGVDRGNVEWGDIDGDEDLDLLISGWEEDSYYGEECKIYINNNGSFSVLSEIDFWPSHPPDFGQLVDFDNNGFLDIFSSEGFYLNSNNSFQRETFVDFAFFQPTSNNWITRSNSTYECYDFDGDGDKDFIVLGLDHDGNPHLRFCENIGGIRSRNLEFEDVEYASLSFGDYDNDGFYDLLYNGASDNSSGDPIELKSVVYKNNQGSNFDKLNDFEGMHTGDVLWLDFDNDNDLDFIISGVNKSDVPSCYLYKNNGGLFDQFQVLTGVWHSSIKALDINHDGFKDLVISGCTGMNSNNDPENPETIIYMNNKSIFEKETHNFPGLCYGDIEVVDLNNNGYFDIILTGAQEIDNWGNPINSTSYLLINNKGHLETNSYEFNATIRGEISSSDYDSNGFSDLVIIDGESFFIYFNEGDLAFTMKEFTTSIDRVTNVISSDFNNDGLSDLFISGQKINTDQNVTLVYINLGDKIFEPIQGDIIRGSPRGEIATIDFDNDSDMDLGFVGGGYKSGWYVDRRNTMIFENRLVANSIGIKNTTPIPPQNLKVNVEEDYVTLSWDPSTDNETSSKSLTYNLMIFNKTTDEICVSPQSNLETGKRLDIGIGNVGLNTSWDFHHTDDAEYEWSVQAIDNSYAGSEFSIKSEFQVETILAIKENTESSFDIYPNPSYGRFAITMAEMNSNILTVEITDLSGRPIYNRQFTKSLDNLELDLNGITGCYIVRIFQNNKYYTKKLLLKN